VNAMADGMPERMILTAKLKLTKARPKRMRGLRPSQRLLSSPLPSRPSIELSSMLRLHSFVGPFPTVQPLTIRSSGKVRFHYYNDMVQHDRRSATHI
jgi:hypothetical protein